MLLQGYKLRPYLPTEPTIPMPSAASSLQIRAIPYDPLIYQCRNRIERCFIHLAAAIIWIR